MKRFNRPSQSNLLLSQSLLSQIRSL
jgi:hypothetical protein